MTFNEEVNIARCLRSVSWSNDVVILDSGSIDATRTIATQFANVRWFEREFTDFADQRNHGIHQIAYRNPWLLVLDADEEVDAELADEIRRAGAVAHGPSVYLIRRHVVFERRVLRWNITSRFWIERLFRPEQVRYAGVVHEKLVFAGVPGRLRGHILHHQFDKGMDDWLQRRARYAEMERDSARRLRLRDLADGMIGRRRWLKALFLRMPARWAVYLGYNLVFALAFLDGRRSIRYIGWEAYSQYLAGKASRRGQS